jgi:hypothetical protein
MQNLTDAIFCGTLYAVRGLIYGVDRPAATGVHLTRGTPSGLMHQESATHEATCSISEGYKSRIVFGLKCCAQEEASERVSSNTHADRLLNMDGGPRTGLLKPA